MDRINIYIDDNNLYRGAKGLGFEIDYKKFLGWLRQKYKIQEAYIFIGFIPYRQPVYSYLETCGFILVFKPTVSIAGTTKGNCDAELVLKVISDFFMGRFDTCILITGDGDFGCLVEFLEQMNAFNRLLAPDENKYSFLLKNKNVEVEFLNRHYHKFSKQTP